MFYFWLRRFIKHSRQCFDHISKHFKIRKKNTALCLIISTCHLVLGNVVKHGLLCLINYLQNYYCTTTHSPPKSNFFLGFCVSFGFVATAPVSCFVSFFSVAAHCLPPKDTPKTSVFSKWVSHSFDNYKMARVCIYKYIYKCIHITYI